MTVEVKSITVDLPVYSIRSKSLRQAITSSTVGGALFRQKNDVVNIRALSNVSLSLSDGDRVGLIGPNGAGKTTLLKVLAGIYTPAQGTVMVRGKISAALNTGLGLDPELTGRENIYLLGYYRNIERRTINRHVDNIIEATELGTFIDLPVHTYSSGMMGRLTFAVATAFQPDVLLMDEWLLAGDNQFMKRASERVIEFVSHARIMVLASHSLTIIRDFCNKAVYLKSGRVIVSGEIESVIEQYEEDS